MKKNTLYICLSAVIAALIVVSIMLLHIPSPTGGYINFGDTFIFLAGALLPMPYALITAAVGGALADTLLGYTVYIPATFCIKALMCAFFKYKSPRVLCARNVIAAAAGALVCVVGYYLFNAIFMVDSNFISALRGIPGDLVQTGASFTLFVLISVGLDSMRIKQKLK